MALLVDGALTPPHCPLCAPRDVAARGFPAGAVAVDGRNGLVPATPALFAAPAELERPGAHLGAYDAVDVEQ